MYGHCIAFQIYIQNALFDRRKEYFTVFFGVDDIDIIRSRLHHILKCSKLRSILQDYLHSQKVRAVQVNRASQRGKLRGDTL